MTGSSATNEAPSFNLTMLLPTLIVDVAAPIAIFKAMEWFGASPIWAIVGSSLPPVVNNLRVWITSRRLEPLGILIVAAITIGTLASLISNNMFYILVKDSFLTGAFGVVFLGSLLASRPLMFFIIRQFVVGDDPSRNEYWDRLWSYAEYRVAIRRVTVLWGLIFIAEALTRIGLAMTVSADKVVMFSSIMGLVVAVLLIVVTQPYLKSVRRHINSLTPTPDREQG